MAKIKIEIGSEKRFIDFVSRIKNQKTAIISHIDLDGLAAAKMVNQVVKADIIKFVEYEQLNENLVKELIKHKIKKVIFTDLYIKFFDFVKSLEKFADVLILDHHLSPDTNSDKTVFIKCEQGYSAGYLCYYLFSKIKNIEKIDWLVACSCISDFAHIKTKEWLENIFKKYGDTLEYERDYVRKSGKFWDLQYEISLGLIFFKGKDMKKMFDGIGEKFGDIGSLKKYSHAIKKDIEDVLKDFSKNKEAFNNGWFYEIHPKFLISSIVSTILSGREVHKTFVIIKEEEKLFRISVRRQDKKVDCDKLLKKILAGLKDADGGGHVAAAGGRFMKKDLSEVRKRLGLNGNKKL